MGAGGGGSPLPFELSTLLSKDPVLKNLRSLSFPTAIYFPVLLLKKKKSGFCFLCECLEERMGRNERRS